MEYRLKHNVYAYRRAESPLLATDILCFSAFSRQSISTLYSAFLLLMCESKLLIPGADDSFPLSYCASSPRITSYLHICFAGWNRCAYGSIGRWGLRTETQAQRFIGLHVAALPVLTSLRTDFCSYCLSHSVPSVCCDQS